MNRMIMPRFVTKNKPVTRALLIFMLGAALGLSACGIKPGNLTPPAGPDNANHPFPRTYPSGN